MITLPNLTLSHWLFILAVFIAVLPIDMCVDLPGQAVLSVGIWLAMFYVFASFEVHERAALWPCLAIATAGEISLSLVWGLYTYRLENIPFFVPPGHVLLLMLAIGMAPHMSKLVADAILGSAVIYGLVAAAAGIDTFALMLLAFLIAVLINSPDNRPFYASTFLVSLALELYGTALGNWTWVREVPVLPFVSTNPPGLVGTFYAVLDTLAASAAFPLARRLRSLRLENAVQGAR